MNLADKLEKIKVKYDSINEQLSDPRISNDRERMISLTRERSDLSEIMEVYSKYASVLKNIKGNKEIIDSVNDNELVSMAEVELEELKAEKDRLEEEIKVLLLPKDPNDDKDVIMEIRAGTGGEEAALFAGDLYRMYSRYAEMRNWKIELIDINDTGLGGIKEVIFSVTGNNVFGDLKFESGVHRVQRVPETEGSGRVHTSAASVAVLPEAEDVQIEINQNDLKIDIFRAGGAGGQNVNKVETAVRITESFEGKII